MKKSQAEIPKDDTEGMNESDKEAKKENPIIWAKLIPKNPEKSPIDISQETFTIGRTSGNTLRLTEKIISGRHCTITKITKEKSEPNYFLEDHSTNGTFHNNVKVGKSHKIQIKNGDEIQLGGSKKNSEAIIFVFSTELEKSSKRSSIPIETEETKTTEMKRKKMDEDVSQEMRCGICIDLIYQPVTLMPCLHTFCAACYSAWVVQSSQCPACRKEISVVKKDQRLEKVLLKFLKGNPDQEKPKEEKEEMDKNNIINEDEMTIEKLTALLSKKKHVPRQVARRPLVNTVPTTMSARDWLILTTRTEEGANRQLSFAENAEEQKEEEKKGRNRGRSRGKSNRAENNNSCYKCKSTTKDLNNTCARCNAKVCKDCIGERGIQRLDQRKVKGVPREALSGNQFEQKILKDYINHNKIDLQELFGKMAKEMQEKGPTYKNSLGKDIRLKETDEVCFNCFLIILNDFMFEYAKSIHGDLGKDVQERPDCWYGKDCTTQNHNPEHAKKYNHICDKKRGK